MKKLMFIAVAVGLVFLMVAPAMAVDPKISGAYRVRGYFMDDYALQDQGSDAFLDMRLRVQADFAIYDALKFRFRFDALDGNTYGMASHSGTNWDRAWINAKVGPGSLQVGRMSGGAFGTLAFDYEGDADRIKYVLPMGNLTIVPIYQKVAEADGPENPALSDADYDAYILALIYKTEMVKGGLLNVYYRDARSAAYKNHIYRLNPYVVATFGNFGLQAELDYRFGDREYEAAGVSDDDYDQLGFNIEGSFNFGAGSCFLGYLYFSGQDPTSTDLEAYPGTGDDWDRLYILTNSDHYYGALGGQGNLSRSGTPSQGANIIYGGVSYNATEALNLGVVAGMVTADETASNVDDDMGFEVDLLINYKIMDNLTWNCIVGFLSAGDYWEESMGYTSIEDTYMIYHKLQVNF